MKFKRGISLALALAILSGMGSPLGVRAAAANEQSAAASDALAALGIDTSKAPDGFNKDDTTSNPYGRSTIKVTPVYELYTVGLTNDFMPSEDDQKLDLKTKQELQHGKNTVSKGTTKENTLQSTLYGHEDYQSENSTALMANPKTSNGISGKTTTTGTYAEISVGQPDGDNKYNTNGYLTGVTNATTKLGDGTSYAMADVAAGHFASSGKTQTDVKSSQIAMVYAGSLSANGGLYLRFGDAVNGEYGSPKTLLGTDKQIGNPTLTESTDDSSSGAGALVENFAENPYQLKNYLQVATGDWNNDGLDEVAVYVPEVGKSRIEVYAIKDRNKSFSDPDNWGSAWTYYFHEGNVVSNMISIVSGDVNQDGIDDLACTWGYYYGPNQNAGSRAVVMFGAKGDQLLKQSQDFGLDYNGSNLVRASFAFGDMTGGGKNLILCAQSDADLKAGRQDTRYVALYSWDGSKFTASVDKNFDLFAKQKKKNSEEEEYVNGAMAGHTQTVTDENNQQTQKDVFHSLPLCPANTAIISRPTNGEVVDGKRKTSDLLYFDSLIISCDEGGLAIKQARDNMNGMPGANGEDYVEYSAAAGALTGANGAGTLFTLTQTMSQSTDKEAQSYRAKGDIQVPHYARAYYYKNWFDKLFKRKTWYDYIDRYDTKTVDQDFTEKYNQRSAGTTRRSMINLFDDESVKMETVNSSYALCLANTDDDTSYMTYTGKHDYVYSDPQVLAVLASPPYFSDLLDRDDLSGNYAESTTTYSKSKESESGSTTSTTLSIGAYVSFEQEFSVFGVKIGQAEAEAQYTAGFTWETEHTTSLEQSIEYGASSGEDKVAFYSIPMEIYEYNSYLPDGKGGYKVIKSTVSIPHEASIGLLGLDEYESIAEDYSVLPSISGNALTHTIGDPSSYPDKPYANSLSYQGTPSKVGFTSKAGGDTLTQSITFTESNSKSYSTSNSVETKAGAGAGGLTVGVVAGSENSAGKVEVSTEGSSFTGSLQQMPAEAQSYGYGMNWRIFCYNYRQGSLSFPVVTYAVSDVQAPSPLPEDFEQNVSETTESSVTLDWSYDKIVSGFNLYRYYNFPDGSGRELIDFIPFTSGKRDPATGTYSFSYTDGTKENNALSPYTPYEYQIQTVNYNNANYEKSIYSEPLSCRTKTKLGYPKISVNGEYKDCTLPIYPDTQSTATIGYDVPPKSQGEYKSVSYQWQKLNGSKWENLPSNTDDSTLRIANAGSGDKGTYRCRLNIRYWDISSQSEYSISAYSPEVKAEYSKRTPAYNLNISDENVQDGDRLNRTLHISADLKAKTSVGSTSGSVPTGTVTFLVKGKNFSASLAAAIDDNGKATAQDLVVPEDGAYSISLYYPGSYVFKGIDGSDSKMYIVGTGTGYQLALTKKDGEANDNLTRFTYGDIVQPTLTKMTDNSSDPATVGSAHFEYAVSGSTEKQPLPDNAPLPVGSYTLYAYDGSTLAAETAFTVVPREVTLRVETPENGVSQNDVKPDTDISFTSKDMSDDEIAALHLTYTAVNSAGNKVTLENNIAPSNYTITPCKSDTTDDALYSNYTFTFIPGIYWVKGLTYELTLEAMDYGEGADKHAVASASIITAGGTTTTKTDKGMKASFAANTEVQMQVIPDPGYAVDHWEYDGSTIAESKGKTTVSVTTLAKPATVKVFFKTALTELRVQANQANAGTIQCIDEYGNPALNKYPAYISNGTSYFFTAVPAEGWHFKQWNRRESNASTYPKGTDNGDGSNTLEMEIGARNVTLIAEFERDKYTLTLDGELTASYTRTKDDGTTEIVPIASGDTIPGDTEITVAPKAGYMAAEGKTYQVDTIPANMTNGTIEDGKYIFAITHNTTVSLETTRLAFAVAAQADDNGTVSVLADGQAPEDPTKIEGGSEVQIKAHANRGWHFDHWEVDGKTVTGENAGSDVYTVKELNSDLAIKAVFAQSKSYTATANVVAANRGEMQYTLYDIYGEEVPTDSKAMPENGVTIYENEQIEFRVVPKTGFSVEKWFVNGKSYTEHTAANPGGRLTATDKLTVNGKITATVHLQTAASYYAYYAVKPTASGTAGGTLTATADGTAFRSNTLLSNGSALVFTATPNEGKMVEKWTVTNGNLNAQENETAVSIEPVFPHTLDGNTSVRVYFTDYAANTVSVANGAAGSGKLTYTTPIQPNEDGKLADSTTSTPVRTNGTVKLTLTPGTNYVGTANEVQSKLQTLAGNDSAVTVTENNGAFEVEIRNVTKEISINPADLFHATYEVQLGAFANGTVTASAARAKAGDTVTLTVAPASGYQLNTLTLTPETKLNETVSASTLKYTFTMPANDVSVAAAFTEKPKQPSGGNTGGGSIGGGGAGGGGGAPAPSGSSIISASDGTKITTEVKINNGTASVTADSTKFRGKDSFTVDLTADKTVHTVSLTSSTVSAMADAKNGAELLLPTGTITLDRDTLAALASAAKTDGTIRISVKNTESTALNDAQRKLLPKNGTLLDAAAYTQSKNGAQTRVHELNGSASITVPYQLRQNETADHLVAYYLAENGSFEKLPVSYNAKTGMASFKTTHFSTFVVAHEYSSDFTDVALNNWFYSEVNTALANGWFKGTTNTTFSPDTGMTRAMLVQVLYRMSGSTASANDKFSDVAADKWYAEAIAWASENGIVTGFADGTFQPDAQVTRQQLAAILYRYDAFTGHNPTGSNSLDAFTDAASVEPWAADAMRWANGTGLVTGVTPTTLVPNGTATRAQVAVILTRYTGK